MFVVRVAAMQKKDRVEQNQSYCGLSDGLPGCRLPDGRVNFGAAASECLDSGFAGGSVSGHILLYFYSTNSRKLNCTELRFLCRLE